MAERTARSKIIGDSACPACKRQGRDRHNNHLIHFDNGNKFCNRCGYKEVATSDNAFKSLTSHDNEEDDRLDSLDDINALESLTVRSRGISEAIMSKYGVKASVNTSNGEVENVYFPITRGGKLTAYKVRSLSEKSFHSVGNDAKKPDLFGQSLAGQGGKFIIITEGEFDCLAVSQMLASVGKNYKVVSLPTGANDSAIKQHMEWLEGFEKVVLWFDNDEAGNKARDACASLLSMGKVYTITTPDGLKDANDCLLAGKNIMQILASAKPIKPDGILSGEDIIAEAVQGVELPIAHYPYAGLNDKLGGVRTPELVVISAGSGVGKSQFLRELVYYFHTNTPHSIALMFMEESVKRTALSIAGLSVDIPLHSTPADQETVQKALHNVFGSGRIHAYNHFGSSDVDNILSKIRYFVKALDCKIVILDHLSIIVSGQDSGMDERKLIDMLMTKLRTLVQELDICIFAVSHLTRPEGKGHEEGKETSLKHLRGSHAIAQLSDAVIGLERNQQAESEEERNTTTVRVLKSRFTGETGVACKLEYNKVTGRMKEVISEGW
jgi:twinkle protein